MAKEKNGPHNKHEPSCSSDYFLYLSLVTRRKLPDALPCARLALSASEFSEAPREGAGAITSFFLAPSSLGTASTSCSSAAVHPPYPEERLPSAKPYQNTHASITPGGSSEHDASCAADDKDQSTGGKGRIIGAVADQQAKRHQDTATSAASPPLATLRRIYSPGVDDAGLVAGQHVADQDGRIRMAPPPPVACLASGRSPDRCHRVRERVDDVVLLEDVDLDEQRRIMEGIQRSLRPPDKTKARVTKRSKGQGQRSILDMFDRRS